MTPDEVRRMRFGRAPFGHRGYDAAEVDAFRERIAQAFLGRTVLTAAELRGHEFATAALGHRGYDRDEVDEFLDRVCVELEFARRGLRRHPGGDALLTPEDVQRLRFSPPPRDHAGYDADEVDVFLDRITTTLAHTGPNGLTSHDVRTVNFGLAHAGTAAYSIEEVDSFLDVVARTLEAEEAARETAAH
ncbi:DivIVA domain-containing protein [Nocardia sp. CDC159]|uniref:Cell wall synthesis protein Wag31 n=1 Tax=Nocardia pulmonis TaxID=2951408 RepID=A0A9X2IXG7_9NOCA|nr:MULTISPECIES: DivIVA domain-containing protein [Nocardia]MCM6774639.1 DivIVA domain-containing protein [Nocardia pulmonis]MCM6787296.1 DivIVA domain-containing protein [Nocardia sp. CDC159]